MRVVRAPGECLGLTLPKRKRLNASQFLFKADCGLARVKFHPPEDLRVDVGAPDRELWLGQWIDYCIRRFPAASSHWLMVTLQSEQRLIAEKRQLPAVWTTRHIPGPGKKNLFSGERPMRTGSKQGWLAIAGNWRMMAAAGYGIPDPNKKCHFPVERWLGFPRQVYYLAGWLADRETEFCAMEAQGQLPTVTLYGGEKVSCADRYSYKVLRYTPNEKEMAHRRRVYLTLKRMGGAIWHC